MLFENCILALVMMFSHIKENFKKHKKTEKNIVKPVMVSTWIVIVLTGGVSWSTLPLLWLLGIDMGDHLVYDKT